MVAVWDLSEWVVEQYCYDSNLGLYRLLCWVDIWGKGHEETQKQCNRIYMSRLDEVNDDANGRMPRFGNGSRALDLEQDLVG